ncbi:hypothetical protein P8936_01490 [Edaphobacter paludis]|uniref:Uncharacterized protein n=1 Tax=Edaphobacter paludis TaxID=3035702 RepID=A0AAU7D990_9BACT
MARAKEHSNSDDDFIKVGPDATATFDNSASNPTEHASSENLNAVETEDDDLEDEDLDEDDDDEDEDYEEEEDEEESDDDVIEGDEEDDDDDDEEDEDLATSPRASSVYRKA